MKVIVFIFLLGLLVACDPLGDVATTDHSPAKILTSCPGFSEIGKPPLVQGAECGTLTVKENPQDENSREIELAILRLPAISATPQADPLFIIAGGPGQSAIDIAEHISHSFHEVRKNRDLVFVDQRGTGKSNPLTCAAFNNFLHSFSLLEQEQALRQAVRDCLAEHGNTLEFYTTPYAVTDLDAVRIALGYQQINLWGVSYGTRVALEYMRRYPQASRSSVLDGVAPLAMALPWFAEEDAKTALIQINQQCAASVTCDEEYGDLLVKADTVTETLKRQSTQIKAVHPRTQAPMTLHMNHQMFASVIRMALYSRDTATLLPLVIARAYEGDYLLLASLIAMIEEQSELSNISHAMHYTILCNEDYPQFQARDFSRSQNFLNINLTGNARDICEIWPRYSLPEDYRAPVKSSVPSLLLSGQRDPVTPPRWAEQMMQNLDEALHLVAPGGHHSITRDGCIAQLIAHFIHQGKADQLDTDCVKNILPLPPYIGAVSADGDQPAAP